MGSFQASKRTHGWPRTSRQLSHLARLILTHISMNYHHQLAFILATGLALAADPAVETKKEKVLEKILDGKYKSGALKELGTETNICKHLDDDHIEAIQNEMNKAHMKLASKCILDILKNNTSAFDKLTEEIHDDEKEKKKFFRVHAALFCENQKPFKEHDEKEWHKPLTHFCAKYAAEDAKQRLEEEKKVSEELREKLKQKDSGAAGLAAVAQVTVLFALGVTALFI